MQGRHQGQHQPELVSALLFTNILNPASNLQTFLHFLTIVELMQKQCGMFGASLLVEYC